MRTVSAGFTLIELMIVVAIIAILAAIAVPAYQTYTVRAQVAEALVVMDRAQVGVWDYFAAYGTLPTDNSDAGLPSGSALGGSYVSSVDVQANGSIHAYFGGPKASSVLPATAYLSMDATIAGHTLQWVCSPGNIASKYVPTACR